MKKQILIYFVVCLSLNFITATLKAQDTTQYFGQLPPGDSAVIFAPDIICFDDRSELGGSFSPDVTEFIFETSGDILLLNQRIHHFKVDSLNNWIESDTSMFLPDTGNFYYSAVFSPDSQYIYLCSEDSLWRSEKDSLGWIKPVPLENLTTGEKYSFDPLAIEFVSISATYDNTIYYTKYNPDSPHDNFDLYSSESQEGNYNDYTIEQIIDSNNLEMTAFIAPDKSYVLFSSIRPEGYGDMDIYTSFLKKDSSWSWPRNLGENVNSGRNEVLSRVSPCGNYLFFTRMNNLLSDIQSDIWWISTSVIDSARFLNIAPKLANPIPDTSVHADTYFKYKIPANTFYEDDDGDTLKLSAKLINMQPLPDWLSFDTITNTFSGTPSEPDNFNILVTATDKASNYAMDIFIITVEAVSNISNNDVFQPAIYPNPVISDLFIDLGPDFQNVKRIEITDITGQVVNSYNNINRKLVKIDFVNHNKGIYFINIFHKNNISSSKIIRI